VDEIVQWFREHQQNRKRPRKATGAFFLQRWAYREKMAEAPSQRRKSGHTEKKSLRRPAKEENLGI